MRLCHNSSGEIVPLSTIQGFPKDYKVMGNQKQQIVQIGNAVPPILIKKIVQTIIG